MILSMEHQLNPLILIVDDDPEIQNLLKKFLKLEKYGVLTFSHALDALAKLEGQSVGCSLVICDLKLPDIDGLEFLERVKKKAMGCTHYLHYCARCS